jgi:NAD(P)H-flavin reductase
MFKILNRQILADDYTRLDIHAPEIASTVKAGQFVRVCPEEGGEHIPLTVVDADALKGSISLIVHHVGVTTRKLGAMAIHTSLYSVLGPLGMPAVIKKKGTVGCLAIGIGIAQILPVVRALRKAGNKVIGIIGAGTKRGLLTESQMRLACNKIFIALDEGSHGHQRLAVDIFKRMIQDENILGVYTIAPVDMMEDICSLTKSRGIETRVTIHTVMADGTGMCGSCRLKVGDKTVFSCVEGPEFDGHSVDFRDLRMRMNAFNLRGDR